MCVVIYCPLNIELHMSSILLFYQPNKRVKTFVLLCRVIYVSLFLLCGPLHECHFLSNELPLRD
jgi:hypothetical protein